MMIKRFTLHNFGIYAGTNVYEFHGEKPVVLIGGMNGRGKTTFLNGILLTLYGSKSFAFKESSYTSYSKYLKSLVNEVNHTHETWLEIEFALNLDDAATISVKRSWTSGPKRSKDIVEVCENGVLNEFLTQNWDMYVESILPSGISSFFFFDGEKIAELAVEATNNQIKESIRSLLGLNVIDTLRSDLDKVSTMIRKRTSSVEGEQKLEELRKERDTAEQNLIAMDEHIKRLTDELEQTEKEIELAQAEYRTLGGDIARQQEKQMQNLAELKAQKQIKKDKLLEFAASELPLNMVSPLLERMLEQAEKEKEAANNKIAYQKFKEAAELYRKTVNSNDGIEEFIHFFKETMDEKESETVFNFSALTLYQLRGLIFQGLKGSISEVQNVMEESAKLNEGILSAENYLSVAVDHEGINKSVQKISALTQKKGEKTVELSNCEDKRKELHGTQIKTAAVFNKQVESLLSNMEYNDDNQRTIIYIHKVQGVLEKYEKELQRRKVDELANTITGCYKQIADKKHLIDRIVMDEVTLDFTYLDSRGKEVDKLTLSAGEKQMMVIAILWALAKCSRKKLPVIIDTPLSRLDGSHREALITKYFPNASEQTIILSTDTEINREYYQMMKPSIGDEYTLNYDDATKSTTIKKGYDFGGEQ